MTQALLQVRNLNVARITQTGLRIAVIRDISFSMARGESVGLLGESGSGKSTLALSLLRLLAPDCSQCTGSVQFESRELATLSEKDLQGIRGAQISLVFQEPVLALNPVLRAGEQVADVLRAHAQGNRKQCREKAEVALGLVFGKDAPRICSAFPHELSGGQRQRVVIAQALACNPALLVADEPTASLDTTVQAEVLALLRNLQKRLQLSLLFITHNPALLAGLVQRVLVMYAGQIVEDGPLEQVLRNPLHPYTAALARCVPQVSKNGGSAHASALQAIPGSPPDLSELPTGCPFEPRCSERMDVCRLRDPHAVEPVPARFVKCFKHGGEH